MRGAECQGQLCTQVQYHPCPVLPSRRRQLGLLMPSDKEERSAASVEVRAIRDDLDARVKRLVAELVGPAPRA